MLSARAPDSRTYAPWQFWRRVFPATGWKNLKPKSALPYGGMVHTCEKNPWGQVPTPSIL